MADRNTIYALASAPGRAGVAVTALVFVLLGWAVLSSNALPKPALTVPPAPVKEIGMVLMTRYVLPLEIVALMLTVAMIGAVVIAYKEEKCQGHASETPVIPAFQSPAAPAPQAALKKEGVA